MPRVLPRLRRQFEYPTMHLFWLTYDAEGRPTPPELRDRAILSLFWCFPYWSRWLTPMDFQWDLVDIFEMTNVSGFLFSKKCSNFFWNRIFGQDLFSNICAVWFPVDWACFWINPGLQKSSISIFVRGGQLQRCPPLRRSLTDHFKEPNPPPPHEGYTAKKDHYTYQVEDKSLTSG